MSTETRAFAAFSPTAPLGPFTIRRRETGAHDVAIEIRYCGVCHSDVHTARGEWEGTTYPVVPGHEMVGVVTRVGSSVTRFKTGDLVGVGCFVDSCRTCGACKEGLEQYCETQGIIWSYNNTERDGTPTYGGYSSRITVDENYVLRIPPNLDLAGAAPLLCAGITTYSPLMHWKVGKGTKLAVVGLGGLGHMAVKIAHALGAEVTVLSQTDRKKADAARLGAKYFYATADGSVFERLAGQFDLIINTVSVPLDWNQYLNLLKRDGTMVLLGVPPESPVVNAGPLIRGRKRLAGSLIGGIRETQEMLDFCGKHGITSDVEVIPIQRINEAYDRMVKGDVRYRFVVDNASLNADL